VILRVFAGETEGLTRSFLLSLAPMLLPDAVPSRFCQFLPLISAESALGHGHKGRRKGDVQLASQPVEPPRTLRDD